MADLKISNPRVVGKLKLPAESASKVLQISAAGEAESSAVTITELGYLSGVTSSVQTQLSDAQADATQALSDAADAQSDITNHIADVANPHAVTKAQVGLSNVDNTSDVNKPVSTAQQTALDLKANLASPTFTGTVSGITKSMVGLSNVDNTSDANKPVSTAQATAIGLKISSTEKGAANGVATLDASSLIPITQLPPAALERLVIVADQAARFALTTATVQNGDTVKQTDTGLMYFVKDDANLGNAAGYEAYTAGSASSVAWSGVTGTPTTLAGYGITDYAAAAKAAAVADSITDGITDVAPSQNAVFDALALKAPLASPTFTGTVSGITKSMVGLGNVDNTSDASKPVSTAQQTALDLKANLASPTFTGTVSGITKSMVGLSNVDNVQQLPISYLDTDVSLAANSDVKVASQKATKAYVDAQIGAGVVAGDISLTSFSAADNVGATDVTGFAFAAGVTRSFKAHVSVSVDATSDKNEVFELLGIQLAGGFVMSTSSVGDDSGVVFSITSAGQVQYASSTHAGFVSDTIKFRAITTTV